MNVAHPTLSVVRIACVLPTVIWSLSTLGQDVADKPDLQLGDKWIFVQTGSENGKPISRLARRQVVEMLADDKIRVSPRWGEIDVYDRSWNPRHPDRPTFWPLEFQFPLRVGAEWSYASPFGASTTAAQNFEQRGHYKVVATELISVEAGRFKCFRIEGESSFIIGYAYSADWKYVDRALVTRWYCPDVKNIAKMHIESDIVTFGTPGRHNELHFELVDFRPGKPVASTLAPSEPRDTADVERATSLFDGRWEGEQGIWRIKGYVSGRSIEGTIQCQNKNGWSARSPIFSGIVEDNGSVRADTTEELQGWSPRLITGNLPNLRVVGYGQLDCPNGEVALKKAE